MGQTYGWINIKKDERGARTHVGYLSLAQHKRGLLQYIRRD